MPNSIMKSLHAMPCVGSLGSIQKPRSMQQIHWGKLRWSLGFILDSSRESNNILELFPICCRFCGPLIRRSSVPRSFGLPQDYGKLQYFQLKATKAANYSICMEDCGCCIHFGNGSFERLRERKLAALESKEDSKLHHVRVLRGYEHSLISVCATLANLLILQITARQLLESPRIP